MQLGMDSFFGMRFALFLLWRKINFVGWSSWEMHWELALALV